MPEVLQLLIQERDRLDEAIRILQGPKRRGRPPGSKANAKNAPKRKGRPPWTEEHRAAQSAKLKAYWKKRRRAAKKTS